jgi:transposase-like protein
MIPRRVRMTEQITVCPECGSPSIRVISASDSTGPAGKRYTCRAASCGERFEEPDTRAAKYGGDACVPKNGLAAKLWAIGSPEGTDE